MTTYRLRVKLGEAEFEAEGPEEAVRREFEDWKAFAATAPSPSVVEVPHIEAPLSPVEAPENPLALEPDQLRTLFIRDEARNLVSLRFLPQGDDRASKAMLLILLGYKRILAAEEVPVTLVKASLELSGINLERVDRDAAPPLLQQNLILKGGKGKGGRYALTNLGVATAEADAIRILRQTR